MSVIAWFRVVNEIFIKMYCDIWKNIVDAYEYQCTLMCVCFLFIAFGTHLQVINEHWNATHMFISTFRYGVFFKMCYLHWAKSQAFEKDKI